MTEQVQFNRYQTNNCGVTVSRCDVTGRSAEDMVEAVLPFIRPQSQEFYQRQLREDLNKHGHSLVDVHAGNGINYTLTLSAE